MRRNTNNHNVPWTFTTHHQKMMALDIKEHGEGHFLSGKIESVTVNGNHSAMELKFAWWWGNACFDNSDCLHEELKYQPLKTLSITGRICKAGTVFLRHFQTSDSQPVFYRISEAILLAGKTFLVMEDLETVSFSRDRFCFTVIALKTYVVLSRKNLKFPAPLHSFLFNNQLYVHPNYYHML
jgi:hypothetical protein